MNYRLDMQLNMLQNGTIVIGKRAYKHIIPHDDYSVCFIS